MSDPSAPVRVRVRVCARARVRVCAVRVPVFGSCMIQYESSQLVSKSAYQESYLPIQDMQVIKGSMCVSSRYL
jgi:hypothetical protein